MRPQAKAQAATSTKRPAFPRPSFRAFVTRVNVLGANGIGARPHRRSRLFLPVAAFLTVAFSASPALGGAPALERAASLGPDSPFCRGASRTSLELIAGIEPHGLETHWNFEYSTTKGGPWIPVPGGSGTITQAEVNKGFGSGNFGPTVQAELTGLTPEVVYYVLATASNSSGSAAEEAVKNGEYGNRGQGCESVPLHPIPFLENITNPTATTVHVRGNIQPNGSETRWRFEYAPAAAGGHAPAEDSPAWVPAPGAEGTVSQAEAEALTLVSGEESSVAAKLTGLTPGAAYAVRLFAEDEPEFPLGSGKRVHRQATSPIQASSFFETEGAPAAATFAVHALDGESTRVLGAVDPKGAPTSEEQTITLGGAPTGGTFTLSFMGETTVPIAFDAPADSIQGALDRLGIAHGENVMLVRGPTGGPYTVEFVGNPLSEKDEPQIVADVSGLTPSGSVTIATTQNGGEGYDTHYHFEYISAADFAANENSFAGAREPSSTPAVDLGLGGHNSIVGADLNGLQPGETYHYRIAATNTSPGDPVVHGSEQTLIAPTPALAEPPAPCPNEALRSGPSSHLPDCRAYEQVTPVEKEGSQDNFGYTGNLQTKVLTGEDGDHFEVNAQFTKWGPDADAHNSFYFFTRDPVSGWQMSTATPQPGAGSNSYQPSLFSPDLTQIGLTSGWTTGTNNSSELELELGPPGGPYTTVASVPRTQVRQGSEAWLAVSADSSKAVFGVEDRTLLGPATGTKEGNDLYEYSDGELRQLNVGTLGATVGHCGATLASAHHAVSADGAHVFFEAVPAGNCSEPSHLYMRVDGAETVDIGEYHLLAADAEASKLLLRKGAGEAEEVFLYETETQTATLLPGARAGQVSADLSTIYFTTSERLTPETPPLAPNTNSSEPDIGYLYRYDVPARSLRFLLQVRGADGEVSPDGRYFSFLSPGVLGVPGGTGHESQAPQAYRYDSATNIVQCISCASSFDPEPKQFAEFLSESVQERRSPDSAPTDTVASANGDYVFFDTTSALLPSDVDGEQRAFPEGKEREKIEKSGNIEVDDAYSPSSDVYEWRKNGIDGCIHLQGCLALITTGTGGQRNMLLGTADEGRDVFIATHSQLVSTDTDTQGDVYDARIDGGFPPAPPSPVECEGDACSSPFAPPSEVTPSSSAFRGAGNPAPAATRPVAKKKAVAKKKPRKKIHKPKRDKKSGKRAKKSARGRG